MLRTTLRLVITYRLSPSSSRFFFHFLFLWIICGSSIRLSRQVYKTVKYYLTPGNGCPKQRQAKCSFRWLNIIVMYVSHWFYERKSIIHRDKQINQKWKLKMPFVHFRLYFFFYVCCHFANGQMLIRHWIAQHDTNEGNLQKECHVYDDLQSQETVSFSIFNFFWFDWKWWKKCTT